MDYLEFIEGLYAAGWKDVGDAQHDGAKALFKRLLTTDKAGVAKIQCSDGLCFNPDWDMLEASQESLREHMEIIKKLREVLEYIASGGIYDDIVSNNANFEDLGRDIFPARMEKIIDMARMVLNET